jgi:hypothetical protein
MPSPTVTTLFTTYNLADGTVKEEAASVGDKVVGFLKAPISFSTDVGVSQSTQAINVLGWSAIALIGGELMGHIRASKGQKAFFPFGRP